MLESLLLVLSLCIDALVASFAYGTNKIKIPFISGTIISIISTVFLLLALGLGSWFKGFLPIGITSFLSCGILLILGISRLFEGILKNFLNKKASDPSHIEFKLFDFKLILNVYADATKADLDHSKVLSTKEATYLGIALSLDSLVVGLGFGLNTIDLLQITLISLILHGLAIFLGVLLGKKCVETLDVDISWLSGFILILLAILNIL
ncbi:sporulation membrane protein YtaF [Cellulosilyticum ruminicola]|uniref:sporulation membrane protein YtaF n=1 Tax=Cellulosilyticum ruminicola TaxID=425254 RepID=UPI0006D06782|nr:sporulation membrane protein YtaF [Cellulosilyticum ruminicola]